MSNPNESILTKRGRLSGRTNIALLTVLLLSAPPSQADTVEYSYDQLGRVVEAVNATTSQATIYAYDAAGNIVATRNVALSGPVAIAGFAPRQGSVGTQVTISGAGFSATPQSNAVAFNGVAATVSSATTSKLVVTVPTGATTGVISITVGASTATTDSSFVVGVGNGPSIGSFTPSTGVAGTSVTVTGTNFQPPAENRIAFNQTQAAVSSATATTLSTVVPSGATSGPIAITTRFGTALSAADFIVPPSGYTQSSMGSSGRMTTDGTPSSVSLATASKIAVQLFDGVIGQYLTLALTNNTVASATIKVFAPNGALLVSSSVTASTPSVKVPRLTRTGTYSIVVDAGSNTGSMNIALYGPVMGTLALDGASVPITIPLAGRRALLTFSGTTNAGVVLAASSVTLPSATLSMLKPDGSTLGSTTFGTSGAALRPLLPMNGAYQVLVDPDATATGNVTLSLSTVTYELDTAQDYYALSATNGVTADLEFLGTAGQYYSVAFVKLGVGSAVSIVAPDGSTVASGTTVSCTGVCGPGGAVLNIGPLAASGAYAARVLPNATGTAHLTLSTPLQPSFGLDVGPQNVTVSRVGQGVRARITGTAGKAFTLGSKVTGSGADSALFKGQFRIVKVAGATLLTRSVVSSTTMAADDITPTGSDTEYSLIFEQSVGHIGTVTFDPYTELPITLNLDGATTFVAATALKISQGVVGTFSGLSGKYVALAVGQAESGAFWTNCLQSTYMNLKITVLKPDGTTLATRTTAGECKAPGFWTYMEHWPVVNVGPLPATGTYKVIVDRVSSSQTGGFGVVLSSPAIITVPTNGSSVTLEVSRFGQGMIVDNNWPSGTSMNLEVTQIRSASGEWAYNFVDSFIKLYSPPNTLWYDTQINQTCSGSSNCVPSVVTIGPVPGQGGQPVRAVIQQKAGIAGALSFRAIAY